MTITVATETPVRQARRADRYAARHTLWKLSRVPRRRECGYKVRDAAGVAVKVTNSPEGRQAGFSGLSSCASVWACPVCSAQIANARQLEIEAALTEWVRRGGRVVLGTVTMRHYRRHALPVLWDGLTAAKHAMLSGAGWQAEQKLFGTLMPRTIKRGKRAGEVVEALRVPVISVVEATEGKHGWHVHLHMLLLVSGDVDAAAAVGMGKGLFGRWSDALVSRGLPAPVFDVSGRGRDFALLGGDVAAGLGDYFTKSVYGAPNDVHAGSMEVARGDFKDSAHGNRTPFGILRSIVGVVTTGDLEGVDLGQLEEDERLWHDWEAASAGRRQIAWSVGLREWLAVLPVEEPTEQEIVDADQGGDEVHEMTAITWAAVRRARGGARLLDVFERSEWDGCLMLARFEDAGFRWQSKQLLL